MRTVLNAALFVMTVSVSADAQITAGTIKDQSNLPFVMAKVAEFKVPSRIAFLPDAACS